MLTIERLSTGYWHVRGAGPCNWAQWPCGELPTPEAFFPEAGAAFRAEVMRTDWRGKKEDGRDG